MSEQMEMNRTVKKNNFSYVTPEGKKFYSYTIKEEMYSPTLGKYIPRGENMGETFYYYGDDRLKFKSMTMPDMAEPYWTITSFEYYDKLNGDIVKFYNNYKYPELTNFNHMPLTKVD